MRTKRTKKERVKHIVEVSRVVGSKCQDESGMVLLCTSCVHDCKYVSDIKLLGFGCASYRKEMHGENDGTHTDV